MSKTTSKILSVFFLLIAMFFIGDLYDSEPTLSDRGASLIPVFFFSLTGMALLVNSLQELMPPADSREFFYNLSIGLIATGFVGVVLLLFIIAQGQTKIPIMLFVCSIWSLQTGRRMWGNLHRKKNSN